MWRQGDILFQTVRSIPSDATKRNHLVLAEGERTGHRHRVLESGVAELFVHGDVLYLDVKGESATVVHDEHKPIEFKKGLYRVWKQREYSPDEIRFVED